MAAKGEKSNEGEKLNIFEITVEDTGIGIKEEEEDQKKLFKAFEKLELGDKTATNSTGVGLGLMISNDLAKNLGPRNRINPITINSALGQGSSFSFEILYQEAQDQPVMISLNKSYEVDSSCQEGEHSNVNSYNQSPRKLLLSSFYSKPTFKQLADILEDASPKKRFPSLTYARCSCPPVLIVDDDMFNLSALETILHSMGLAVVSAFNGKAAIEKVVQREQTRCCAGCLQFSLIFMDCNMPILDGFEATKLFKSLMQAGEIRVCPIIACTAFVQASDRERCQQYGMVWMTI